MMFSLMVFFLVVNLTVMMRELTGSQPMSANVPPVPASGPYPQYGWGGGGGGGDPRCVLSTAAALQMKVSAVLIVATLSHSVPALRS